MARPRKQTVDYFPHVCKHGKTMFILEQKYGNDGYAFWFKLLEMLGDTEGHYLHFENGEDWEFLQAKTRMGSDKCQEILNLLASLGAIDKELWCEHKAVWSVNFINNIADAYRNRTVEIPDRPSFLRKKPISNGNNDVSNSQTRLENTRLENNRESTSSHKLAAKLFNYIKTNDPKAKEPNLNKWADTMRLLQERDSRTEGEIEAVIEWCQNDSFWKTNILSADKLRKQFSQLLIKMNSEGGNKNGTPKQNDGRMGKEGRGIATTGRAAKEKDYRSGHEGFFE